MSKIGRNDPCWCKSGKKYKRCHLGLPETLSNQTLESVYGEFGARSMKQSLENIHQEKSTGVSTGKDNLNDLLNKIMTEKQNNKRIKPSSKTILGESKIADDLRKKLIDIVGEIVDQNWCGRSEMCVLAAILFGDALKKLGKNPKVIIGKGIYYEKGNPSNKFEWDHAWVELEGEIIDGNVDSMVENPVVPQGIEPQNYWGLKENLPNDRKLVSDKEIDEEWIRVNTSYEELQEWRLQLYQV